MKIIPDKIPYSDDDKIFKFCTCNENIDKECNCKYISINDTIHDIESISVVSKEFISLKPMEE